MKIKDYYRMCIEDNYLCGFLLVQLLVFDKKQLTMQDDVTKIDYFLQPRFKIKMNEHLEELAKKFNYQIQV